MVFKWCLFTTHGCLGMKNGAGIALDGHVAIHTRIARAVHLAHATRADFVRAEFVA